MHKKAMSRDARKDKSEAIVGAAVKGLGLSAGETLEGVRKGLEGLGDGIDARLTSDNRKALEEENTPLVSERCSVPADSDRR